MCGRYAATANPDELVEEFEVEQGPTGEPARSILKNPAGAAAGSAGLQPRADQAGPGGPHQGAAATDEAYDEDAPAVRQLRLLTWGLVPSWAKDIKIGLRMINARAESVLEKPAFAKAAASAGAAWCRPPAGTSGRSPDGHRRQGQPAQAAVLHAPRRRVAAGVRRAVRVLAGPQIADDDDPRPG